MNLKERLKNGILVLDGAMGTELQKRGLALGELPEDWNLTRPDVIRAVHRAYLQAGSDIIYANTFGANCLKLGERTEEVVRAGVEIARSAAKDFKGAQVALDIGPTGRLLSPLGDLAFEDAVNIFKRTIKAGAEAGADLIAVETMNDCYELKAAIIAAKESCSLPVFATAVFGRDEKMMSGTSPEALVALLEGLGVDALGVNCSLAPKETEGVVERMLKVSSTPVIVKPNAGLPEEVDGKTVYSLSAREFAGDLKGLAEKGALVLGGCCGTSPEYIRELKSALSGVEAKRVTKKNLTVISSYTHAVYFGERPVMIGERINPTGKKKLKEALRGNDISYVLGEAVAQEERGAHALDVNVGLPELDEKITLVNCVKEIQAVTALPLQIDTSSYPAMEGAMRIYNGVPLVNSVNGKPESMAAVFPLIKKYGGCAVCLTLDENGIPASCEGRVAIAEKIIETAEKYGILRHQLIFDTLAMAVSADSGAANASLEALQIIRHRLGCNTSLGVSNISFGLPQRDFITAAYFTLALSRGLSAAIYNPYSFEMEKAYRAYMALTGRDESCAKYVEFAEGVTVEETTKKSPSAANAGDAADMHGLKHCIVKGLKERAADMARAALESHAPLDVINGEIIPALDEVGAGFENKKVYLPQLLMSAEAAGAAFDAVKEKLSPADNAKKTRVVLATVKGDIHDIGKNIVATILRNYGFSVYDLGRDVAPEAVVDAALKHGAHIVGLSALMTTTVASMKETVALLKERCPSVKICVGGAVLTPEYARMIGADAYCKDAMATVRFAEEIEGTLN